MKSLKQSFLKKYPKYEIILRMFEEANGCPATWGNLSKVRLQNFVDYMLERMAQSSARQYAAKFKAVLNLYSEEAELPGGYMKVLTIKDEKPVPVWLNDDELEKLSAYIPLNDNERTVQSQFLMGAYSGARHSDYCRFTKTNIVNGYISYVSQKTKTHATVPLKPIVAELLEGTHIKSELSTPAFNSILRRICRASGIVEPVKVFKAGKEAEGEKWEFVSSHTARRSFASNLYLRGADLYSISKMMGHSSVEMTAKNYICCGLREQSVEVMEYFR